MTQSEDITRLYERLDKMEAELKELKAISDKDRYQITKEIHDLRSEVKGSQMEVMSALRELRTELRAESIAKQLEEIKTTASQKEKALVEQTQNSLSISAWNKGFWVSLGALIVFVINQIMKTVTF